MNTLVAQQDSWSWMMGDDPSRAGTPQLQWSNFPESWGVFVLLAIVALIAFVVIGLYRRELDVCPMPVKMLLAGLRLTVLLMLFAMLLRPSMFYQQINEIKPNINFVRDTSLSFARGDRYRDEEHVRQLSQSTGISASEIIQGQATRSELANKVFADPTWLASVRQKGSVQVIDFSDGTESVAVIPATVDSPNSTEEATEGGTEESTTNSTEVEPEESDSQLIRQSIPAINPNGLGTDIWQALRESLGVAGNLSAIVLLSDGQHNGLENPVEMAIRAASLEIPIYVVGIGDPNPPRNVAVSEVFVRNKTYPNEPFEIEALLQMTSYAAADMPEQINVELIQQKINERTGQVDGEQVIKQAAVNVPETGGRVRIDFEHTLTDPGRYVYTVVAESLDNETNVADNRLRSGEMQVVDEKIRVLLISGLPSWDYQQVQRLLQRDQTIALSCWLQSLDDSRPQEGDMPINRLPRSIEELGQYNVILMMDPDPQEFDAQWIEALQVFCKNKAGGLFFMAGPQFTSEFVTLNRLQGIRDLLPVQMGDVQHIDSSDALAFASSTSVARMLPVRHNLDHPILSFHSDAAENERRWSSMPGIYWSFPALSGKPTARVLMERGDQTGVEGNIPLIATGRFGAGTVVYMGFQGTWRWRPVGLQAQFFDRFWIQLTRYLIENRSLQGSRRGFIDTEKTEYELGERILFVARVLDQQFLPSTEPSIPAQIKNQQGRTQIVQMQLLPGGTGQYEGNTVATRTGLFEATLDLSTGEEPDSLIEPIGYRVVPPQIESNAFWLNETLLREIAEQSGGKYFRLNEIDQLPSHLPQRSRKVAFKSPSRPAWDWNAYFRTFAFALPVLLLTIEWAVRKWYKLL